MPKNAQTTAQLHSSHMLKVMLKILQARLQEYVNHELPDGQAGFRKVRGTRDQIANIRWLIGKARSYSELIYYFRAPSMKELPVLTKKAEDCFRAAALATGCTVRTFKS